MSFLGAEGLLLCILSTIFCGFFAVSITAKEVELPFKILLGIGAGFGIYSVLYFFLKVLQVSHFGVYVFCEMAILILLGCIFFARKSKINLKTQNPEISIPFLCALIVGFAIYMKYFIINALGSWDGFRIWGIKAKFLYEMSPFWERVFQLPHFMMHNDYPLFVPANFARLWHYSGGFYCDAPNIFGLIFTFSSIFLLFFALKTFKNKGIAALYASILSLSPLFLANGAAQAADIPLSFLYLCSAVSLVLFFEKNQTSYLALGTFFAGMSAWTKNEGMMFLLVYCGVLGCYFLFKREWRNIFALFLAFLPFAALISAFKHIAHTPNDVIWGITTLKTYNHLLDISKYILVVKTFFFMLFTRLNIMFLLLIPLGAGIDIKQKQKTPIILLFSIFLLMAAGHFLIYLLSPHDLDWHLENSLDRLMLQMLPFSILLLGLVIRENRTK